MKTFRAWIEAMRLRTLPVSLAGVVAGLALAIMAGSWSWLAAGLCLGFALLAQISSNFANEYFDFKAGLDKAGREGPRRGVTEGDIAPEAMKWAAVGTLGAACVLGLCMLPIGGWWLLPVGMAIAAGAFAYSAGPYPLSHHGLGEAAVVVFFGIAPVSLTCYLITGGFSLDSLLSSVAIGLMGANVLIINNYRDCDDDASVGKRTLAVILGRPAMAALYLANGIVAVALMLPVWLSLPMVWLAVPVAYLAAHTILNMRMRVLKGRALNPLLGLTAMLMAAYALLLLLAAATS